MIERRSGHAYTSSLLHGKGLTRPLWSGQEGDLRGRGGLNGLAVGFKSEGLDHYAHVLNQHKLLLVG